MRDRLGGSLLPGSDVTAATSSRRWSHRLAGETFKLLGDVTRLKILWALLHGEHSVTALAAHVGANVPAVSQQLAKLRMARLVRVRRDGNHVFYTAEDAHVRHLVEQALFHTDHVVGGLPDHEQETPETPPTTRKRRRA
jgi:DNA-binding transcriptional ArsR family regulator